MRTLVLLSSPPRSPGSPGPGQDETPPRRAARGAAHVSPSTLLGTSRVVALGGAYVGIAEGTEGFNSNVASLAHRSPQPRARLGRGLHAHLVELPFTDPEGKDVDNDGLPDEALEQLAALVRRAAAVPPLRPGASCATATWPTAPPRTAWRTTASAWPSPAAAGGRLRAWAATTSSSRWASTPRGHASTHRARRGATATRALAFDFLFRPQSGPTAWASRCARRWWASGSPKDGQSPFLAGRPIYSAVVSPATLSLGVS